MYIKGYNTYIHKTRNVSVLYAFKLLRTTLHICFTKSWHLKSRRNKSMLPSVKNTLL